MSDRDRIGVVLLQLGGPADLASVEPFLYNLFADPDIIDLPLAFLFRRPLARMISRRRAPKVQEYYKKIGGGSPIVRLTARQARALERLLCADGVAARVVIAMRYWYPLTEEAVDILRQEGISRVVLLPLYPQYSRSSTGSSLNEWKRVVAQRAPGTFQTAVIDEYCEHPLYIKALVNNIGIALRRVPPADRRKVHLVFSAHGTPMKLVNAGDPYQGQVIRTYDAVLREGNFGLPHHLCYQSKVGPQEWLKPSLVEMIADLGARKVSHLLVVPVAFVSDHSETLYEINMLARGQARESGISYFDMMPALHTNPLFVRALADLVRTSIEKAPWNHGRQ